MGKGKLVLDKLKTIKRESSKVEIAKKRKKKKLRLLFYLGIGEYKRNNQNKYSLYFFY